MRLTRPGRGRCGIWTRSSSCRLAPAQAAIQPWTAAKPRGQIDLVASVGAVPPGRQGVGRTPEGGRSRGGRPSGRPTAVSHPPFDGGAGSTATPKGDREPGAGEGGRSGTAAFNAALVEAFCREPSSRGRGTVAMTGSTAHCPHLVRGRTLRRISRARPPCSATGRHAAARGRSGKAGARSIPGRCRARAGRRPDTRHQPVLAAFTAPAPPSYAVRVCRGAHVSRSSSGNRSSQAYRRSVTCSNA